MDNYSEYKASVVNAKKSGHGTFRTINSPVMEVLDGPEAMLGDSFL